MARKTRIALGISAFDLVSFDGSPLPPFSAGAHIDVAVPGGFVRQYSLCNDPSEPDHYRIAVLNEQNGRGGSRAMHEMVREGDCLSISAPRNHFPLAASAQRSLLLAGGIGITPLLAMAETLSKIDHPFELHYSTRCADRTAFREHLGCARYRQQVHFHFDDGPADQRAQLRDLLRTPRPSLHLYTCGPKGYMDAVLSTARESGWDEDHLHYEFFKAEPPPETGDAAFEVLLAHSRRVIPVAVYQTVTAALAAHGICVPTSCEQGVCGTCLTHVIDGEADHRDLFLTPEEQAANDRFLPCVSRAKSNRLVLDL